MDPEPWSSTLALGVRQLGAPDACLVLPQHPETCFGTGMHYALQAAAPGAQVVAAFDVNTKANEVYRHNCGLKPSQVPCLQITSATCMHGPCSGMVHAQSGIEGLTAPELDAYGADLWLLAPPCQPYARTGSRQGSKDPRAGSFLHLLSLLPQLKVCSQMLPHGLVYQQRSSVLSGSLVAKTASHSARAKLRLVQACRSPCVRACVFKDDTSTQLAEHADASHGS